MVFLTNSFSLVATLCGQLVCPSALCKVVLRLSTVICVLLPIRQRSESQRNFQDFSIL